MPSTDIDTAKTTLISRSVRALRHALVGIGGGAVAAMPTTLDAVAKELSRAERRRRRRQREREEEREEREEEREALRARRRRRNDDDDDDDEDDHHISRIDLLRARHAALMERGSGSDRRVSARQSADEDEKGAGGRARRRDTETDDDASTDDDTSRITAPQVADLSGTLSDSETDTDTGSETAEIRVGSGDTFASIDPETGTATAESNGVRAIAGPDGAFIEGTPGGDTPTPTSPSDDFFDVGDGNDDGLDDPIADGGNNLDEEPMS